MSDAPHILLVNADEADRRTIRRALVGSGLTGEFAEESTAAGGLARMRDGAFDCALFDLHLPDMGGLELVRAARAAGASTPIVLLTGDGDDALGTEAVRAGASDFLVKARLSRGLLAHSVRQAIRLHVVRSDVSRATAMAAESEARFRTMADDAPVLMWMSDETGASTYFNRAWLAFRGRTIDEERGAGWQEGIHPDDRAAAAAECAASWAERRAFAAEFRVRRHDGAYRWVLDHGTPRFLADGAFAGFVGSCVDITERKEAGQRLVDSERRLSAVVSQATAGIAQTDATGRFVMVNQRYCEILGRPERELLGMRMQDVTHPDDLPENARMFGRLVAGGPSFVVEKRYARPDGSVVWVSNAVTGLAGADGRVEYVVAVVFDVTDRKRAEEAVAFLADASVVLAGSLDYETTLASVARLAVPTVADWCAIDMIDDAGDLRRLAVAHADPEMVRLALDLNRRFPPPAADAPFGVRRVVRTGESELVARVTDDWLVASCPNPEQLAIVRRLGLCSAMIVPLAIRGKVVGAIHFATGESGWHYAAKDLALAEDLARRAAAAVDNARLYREAQEALAANAQAAALLDTLFATAPVGLCFVDREFRFVRTNRSMAEANGRPVAFHLGRHVADVSPALWDATRAHLKAVVRTGKPVRDVEASYAVPGRPGEVRHWLTSWYPVFAGGNDVVGVGVVSTEITDRKRAETDLKAARDHAEAANRAKDQFLAVLSHELRTPLTPVLTAVQMLMTEPGLPADVRASVDMIHRNVELEARLIDDLLDLTRIEKGKLELDLRPADAHACARGAVAICATDIAEKRIAVRVQLDAGRHHVLADAARLHQVFWNLIKNAVKFTPAGGSIAFVTADAPGDLLRVTVSDTGVGMAPELVGKVFDAFEQGGPGITKRFGGLGLGLAISKRLVDLHGGRLTAASDGPGRGATFTIELPAIPAPRAGDATSCDGPPATARVRAAPVRILMVDDHEDTSRAMKRLLERLGYHVQTAHTVRQAIDKAFVEDFDLLVSDIGLPDGSGLDLIRAVRARKPIRGIALSGFGMEEDVRKSMDAGFHAHLTKPINFQKLETIIRDMTAAEPVA